ncbi:MAG: replicative DNA helicase [Eubacterium sp.]|nr:replicative DNA helicase [Eubacterium sp.]
MDEVVKRVMPHSNEAEQAVIGSMLMDAKAISVVGEMISADDFYQKNYAELFKAMMTLSAKGQACDLVTVKAQLEEQGVSSEIVSLDFIKNILDMVTTSANVREYAKIVHDKAVLRRLIRATEDITNKCYAGNESSDQLLEETEKEIFELVQKGHSSEIKDIKDIALEVVNNIEKASKTKGSITGIKTGYKKLDYKLSGLQPSDLILIAARPSVGKTALALNIAEQVGIKQNIPVAIFSAEMSDKSLVQRMLSQVSMISGQKIRNGELSDREWENLVEAANTVGQSNIIINDTSGIDVNVMRSQCRKLKLEKDIQLIIVDYVQLLTTKSTGSNMKIGNREQEVAEISRTLKAIAKDLNVPVIALSQLNRGPETREDKKPNIGDLRESGGLEQDADVAILLSRAYDKETKQEDKNRIIVNVAKQRNGPTGELELVWLSDYTKYENPETGHI